MYATPERTTSPVTDRPKHAPRARPSGRDMLRDGALGTQLIRLAELAGRAAAPVEPAVKPGLRAETSG